MVHENKRVLVVFRSESIWSIFFAGLLTGAARNIEKDVDVEYAVVNEADGRVSLSFEKPTQSASELPVDPSAFDRVVTDEERMLVLLMEQHSVPVEKIALITDGDRDMREVIRSAKTPDDVADIARMLSAKARDLVAEPAFWE